MYIYFDKSYVKLLNIPKKIGTFCCEYAFL